ncbi:MAG TPA: protein-L-isoaspartate(D-aspartate) O-methyltransferase [Candidatus Defluviicoccus seviourii]|nr:protein-L-isoaspartate(D-aspartate) O-methyltransferase [Candidatus Defluviicoccus seviourii]
MTAEDQEPQAMSSELHSMLQRQMMDVIAVHAFYVRESIGKEALDPRVLEVIAAVPRHDYVPLEVAPFAYADQPLPIGCDKTISQPFMIALMTDLLDVGPDHTVLEIGTGLGYHASILAALARHVYSIEIIEELHAEAKRRLGVHGLSNITLKRANGEHGWPEYGPFDRILVCAASELMLPALIRQLKPGGKMIVPTGLPDSQVLLLAEKDENGRLRTKEILPVRFALMETDVPD